MDRNLPVVLDTSVASIIYNHDWRARYYEEQIEGHRALISFQTLEEMFFGALSNKWGERRRQELRRFLNQFEVIWPSPSLIEVCAQLRSERRSVGRELKSADAWIAATAILLGYPLVADDGDFQGIPGLEIIRYR